METCGSRLFLNIYNNIFKKIYIRPTRHLCSKKEDKSRPLHSSSNEPNSQVNQQSSGDSIQHFTKDEAGSAGENEAIKSSTTVKSVSQGNEDKNLQAKLLSVLTDIKVLKAYGRSTFNNLAKPPQRIGKKKDPEVEKEKEVETQLRVGYGEDMPSAVKAVASSLGGDVKQTEQKLVQTLTSIANGLPIEEPAQETTESTSEKDERSSNVDEMSKNMMSAVEAVASSIAGEPKGEESELTKKLLSLAAEKSAAETADMSEVVGGMKVDRTAKEEGIRQPRGRTLPAATSHRKLNRFETDLFGSAPLNAFKLENREAAQEESPQLTMWHELQKKDLQSLVQHAPSNTYEEMIRWTEQGKLWTFPINNEAGMHEEENVSFHEHVMLDHLLQEGFPKKGPIRHFMELVITGLSKNPYVSVQRKAEHVNWYREYFKTNREILEQYGIVD